MILSLERKEFYPDRTLGGLYRFKYFHVRTFFIFFMCNIFKIFYSIVRFITIFVINCKSYWSFSKKCFSNQRMNKESMMVSHNRNMNLKIWTTAHTLFQNSPLDFCKSISSLATISKNSFIKRFYSSKIGSLVMPFISWNVFPYFHVKDYN